MQLRPCSLNVTGSAVQRIRASLEKIAGVRKLVFFNAEIVVNARPTQVQVHEYDGLGAFGSNRNREIDRGQRLPLVGPRGGDAEAPPAVRAHLPHDARTQHPVRIFGRLPWIGLNENAVLPQQSGVSDDDGRSCQVNGRQVAPACRMAVGRGRRNGAIPPMRFFIAPLRLELRFARRLQWFSVLALRLSKLDGAFNVAFHAVFSCLTPS